MKPDPAKRAEALSRLGWTPPDEDELHRLERAHVGSRWPVIGAGLTFGLGLVIVNETLLGIDLWTLVKRAQIAALMTCIYVAILDEVQHRAAWKPLSHYEVENLFGDRTLHCGSFAHPDPKVRWLRRLLYKSVGAGWFSVTVLAVILCVWLVKTNPAYADRKSHQSLVTETADVNYSPLKAST